MERSQIIDIATQAAQHVMQTYKAKEQYKVRYHWKNPIIKEIYPDLKDSTLKGWCMSGKLGKLGTDNKYYVTIEEIENQLFKK